MFLNERLAVRLNSHELKLINKVVESDPNLESGSMFVRACLMRELRKRFPSEMSLRYGGR